jgi:hypothetical protein
MAMLCIQLTAQPAPDRWQHPSRTWDKHRIGSITVGAGWSCIVGAIAFTTPNRIGYALYGTGVALTVGGAAYWIIGEQRYYSGKMKAARFRRHSKRFRKLPFSE